MIVSEFQDIACSGTEIDKTREDNEIVIYSTSGPLMANAIALEHVQHKPSHQERDLILVGTSR